jgi:hypothetical protein
MLEQVAKERPAAPKKRKRRLNGLGKTLDELWSGIYEQVAVLEKLAEGHEDADVRQYASKIAHRCMCFARIYDYCLKPESPDQAEAETTNA